MPSATAWCGRCWASCCSGCCCCRGCRTRAPKTAAPGAESTPHPDVQAPVAVVDPTNCNGCRRCFDDCPYAAVTMVPHPDKRLRQMAQVDADLCASCGICVGACPSSTPFRSAAELVTGIDMPSAPIGQLRQRLQRGLAAMDPNGASSGGVRLRPRRAGGRTGRAGRGGVQSDVHRPVAAVVRRIRAARRRRRRAGHRLPRHRLRVQARPDSGPPIAWPAAASRICASVCRASGLHWPRPTRARKPC